MTTVSVVLAAVNEGADLEATLALIAASKRLPAEIIVVDDGSRVPLEPRCAHARDYCPVRVLRNEIRLGSGRAKSIGAAAATGDIVVVMDSHMRPPWQWLDLIVAAWEKWPSSVLCPRSAGFECPPAFDGRGARFQPNQHGFWEGVWDERPSEDGGVIGCVMGGCYIVGRELLKRLGGYAPCNVGWGYEEESLSLRAWIAGHDCRLLNFAVPHQYVRTVDRRDAAGNAGRPWEVWTNRHIATASLWEPGRYENVYAPVMWAHYSPPELRDEVANAAPDIARMRQHMTTIRARSDEEIGFRLGIPHPSTPEQYGWLWSHIGKRA